MNGDSDPLQEVSYICIDSGIKRCPLCEEPFYPNTVYHMCPEENFKRLDLYICDSCHRIASKLGYDSCPSLVADQIACQCYKGLYNFADD